jgi:hypothetical protein
MVGTGGLRGAFLAVLIVLAVWAAPAAVAAPAPSRWCGGDETGTDRRPDAVASYQLHAVYAIPSDGTDRFFERALPIARDLASIDTWWRQQDPTRTLRWDLQAFPGCDTAFGDLDISVVRLPQPSTAYASIRSGGYTNLARDLSGILTDPFKKYAVFYDGPIQTGEDVCGVSSFGPIDRGASYAFTLINADPVEGLCGSLGNADYMAVTEVHEVVHNLGAVSTEAPHQCDSGHVCDSAGDLMAAAGTSNNLFEYALDVGHDDYYGHSGSWWDVQDSPFLSHLNAPQFGLTVAISGADVGSVASDLPGIACPPACSIAFDSGTVVRLTASFTGEGTRFTGWSGACTGDTCEVTMDAAKSVTANFAVRRSVRIAVVSRGGAGHVISTPAGIDCPGGACESLFDSGVTLALKASPEPRSRLAGWSLASCGTHPTCALTVTGDTSLSATFGPAANRLTASVTGQGRVQSTPAGLSCSRSCSRSFPYGRSVRLTARPAAGWRFAGWSGACHGGRGCIVKLVKTSQVRATFRRA